MTSPARRAESLPELSSEEGLRAYVRQASVARGIPEDVAAFVQHFRERFPVGLLGVAFYGSRLSPDGHAAKTSLYDFFLFVDDYGRFFGKGRRKDALLGRVLAPSTYYLKLGDARCKYNVISLRDFEHEVAPRARDLFHAGRFSKRVQLVWTRDDAAEEALTAAFLTAMRTVAPMAIARLGAEFGFEDFLVATLALSYAAEIRVESDSKVGKLLEAHRAYYEAVYGELLRRAEADGLVVRGAQGRWHQEISTQKKRRAAAEKLLRRSRRRMYARWFKYMLTLDDWVDLMIEKVERTKGIKIELTPLERKYAFIFGWRHFFKFFRKGLVK